MTDILKKILWYISKPFVGFAILVKFLFTKLKVKKYLKDKEEFLDEEKYETIYKLTRMVLFYKGIKPEFSGKEKILNKPQLFIANHRGMMDAVIMFNWIYKNSSVRPVFVAKKELLDSKIGFVFQLIDTIFIDRNNLRDMVKSIEKQKEFLKNNKSIVLFPEGTRNIEKTLLEFKSGAFDVAYKTMSTIQPFIFSNTEYFHEDVKNKKTKRVHVKILDPILPKTFIHINRNIFVRNLQKTLQKAYDEISIIDDSKKSKKED